MAVKSQQCPTSAVECRGTTERTARIEKNDHRRRSTFVMLKHKDSSKSRMKSSQPFIALLCTAVHNTENRFKTPNWVCDGLYLHHELWRAHVRSTQCTVWRTKVHPRGCKNKNSQIPGAPQQSAVLPHAASTELSRPDLRVLIVPSVKPRNLIHLLLPCQDASTCTT